MKDQKQPGKLLRQLRQKLGYTLEDWAAIFETTPTIIASIELGQEMPTEFLAKLIEWFIKTMEHPQKPTHILPHLPKKLEDWFKADYLPTDKETKELRKRVLEMVNREINSQQQRISDYLQTISDQKEYLEEQEEQILEQEKQIADLKKVKTIDREITRFQGFSKVFQGVLLFLVGGFLFIFTDQWLPERSPSMEAFSLEGMTAQRDLPIPPTEKAKKAKSLSPSLPKSFLVVQKRAPLARQVMPPQKVVENKNKPVLNNDLFNLLAVNGERKMSVPQKYISDRGDLILKFNNPNKKKMIIVVSNPSETEVVRDTTYNQQYLLDTGKFAPGKYHYRAFTLSKIVKKVVGKFTVENKD